VISEDDDRGDPDTGARLLDHSEELLHRQVHPQWVVDGERSSQAFRPTKKDDGMLSIALGSKSSGEEAFIHHTRVLNLASGGTWAVTVGEASAVDLRSFEQPLENSPAHGFLDFRGLSRGAAESKAKLLRIKASERGCVYAAP